MSAKIEAIKKLEAIQRILGVRDDGDFWGESRAALEAVIATAEAPHPDARVTGYATSFADPADVAAFKRCKRQGKTDKACFAVGDNGIGKWGDDTTVARPMCALPPEKWKHLGKAARGALVRVSIDGGRSVVCELRDTMPAQRNIKNGAVIDLNPAAISALGKKPPAKFMVTWEWA